MKYTKKIPEPDPKLREALLAEGWEKIREPYNLFYAFIFAIPFMIINASICCSGSRTSSSLSRSARWGQMNVIRGKDCSR
jgi:hypothetical protein